MPRTIKSSALVEKITSSQFNIMTDYRLLQCKPRVEVEADQSIIKRELYLHPYIGFIAIVEPGKNHKGRIKVYEKGIKVIYEFSIKKDGKY